MELDQFKNLIFKAIHDVNDDNYASANEIMQTILNDKYNTQGIDSLNCQLFAIVNLAVNNLENALNAFKKCNNLVGQTFVLILMRDLKAADNVISLMSESPISNWFLFITRILLDSPKSKKWPTFFAIRNYLEFTIYYLLLTKNIDYIQKILSVLGKLTEINLDSEKFIGYAYCRFGDSDSAIKFLTNALLKNQYDGEIHFVLAQAYLMKNDFSAALSMLENAKLLLPNHMPTVKLLESTKKRLNL